VRVTPPRDASRLRWIVGAVLVGGFAACALALARSHIDPHDGSCIAVLARNLATTGQYGYAKYDRFELWPVEATTGPTLVVPLALGYLVGGTGPFVANVVCALLASALFAVVWLLLAPRLTTPSRVLSAALALGLVMTVTIKPAVAFVVPRGEVVAALLALDRTNVPGPARLLASGLVLGLGVGSKLLLLLPGAVLLAAVALWALRARGVRAALAASAAAVAGLVLVLLAIEAWKLSSLGSWAAYGERSAEFADFFRVAGSGLRDGPAALEHRRTVGYRLGVLYGDLGWTPLAFAAALAAAPLLLLPAVRRRALGAEARVALVLAAEAVAVVAWWLWRAEIPWLRYLFFASVTAPLAVHFLLLASGRRTALLLGAWAALLALAVALSPAETVSRPSPFVQTAPRTRAVLEAAGALRTLRDADAEARLWSAGWWRHWDLQDAAPLALHDLLDPNAVAQMREGHDFLVTSDYFNWEQDPRLLAVVEAHRRQVAYRNDVFIVYRLHPGLTRKALRDTPLPASAAAALLRAGVGAAPPPSAP